MRTDLIKAIITKAIIPVLIVLFLGGSFVAEAVIQLPANEGQRNEFLARLQRICGDYPLSASQNAAGDWVVVKGDRLQLPTYEFVFDEETNSFRRTNTGEQPSNVTPKGCKLICDLVDHAKKVTLVGDNTQVSGSTRGDNAANRNNGTGTDSTVRFNMALNDNSIFVYDGRDPAGKYINIPHPRDISLAHELIHALHNLNGTRKAADPEGQTIDGSSAGGPGGHGITENDIRDEQNRAANYRPPLLERHGHCGGFN